MRRLIIRTLWAVSVVVVLAAMALMASCNSYSQRRIARLVGIDTYWPVSDAKLNEFAKTEYPIGMAEQDALDKLKRRGLYESPRYTVQRHVSEDDPTTEYFVVLVPSSGLGFVSKEYNLVLEFDSESHQIKHSEISYGLIGF